MAVSRHNLAYTSCEGAIRANIEEFARALWGAKSLDDIKLVGFTAPQLLELKHFLDQRDWSWRFLMTALRQRFPVGDPHAAWRAHFGLMCEVHPDGS